MHLDAYKRSGNGFNGRTAEIICAVRTRIFRGKFSRFIKRQTSLLRGLRYGRRQSHPPPPSPHRGTRVVSRATVPSRYRRGVSYVDGVSVRRTAVEKRRLEILATRARRKWRLIARITGRSPLRNTRRPDHIERDSVRFVCSGRDGCRNWT